jgi:predicted ATP-grasp superfamily ATP-dependent carboligase
MRSIAEPGVYDEPAHQVDHGYHFVGPIGRGVVRIHVFEFICGGGLTGLPIPAQLAREGDLMLVALIQDLLEVPGVQVSFARDARLAPLAGERLRGARVCWRAPDSAPRDALEREIAAADAICPIAPETGGELERAARAVLDAGRMLFGPDPDAIALAGSKFATAHRLAQAGIGVVPCFRPGSAWAAIDGPWVVKPDDGAGCVDTRVFGSREQAASAAPLDRAWPGLVAQPWIEGEAMSLCALAAPGRVEVLSVNRQQVRLHDGAVELVAIEVNCEPVTAPLAALAERVAATIPGLRGYFGIDFVRTSAGPLVIEVNPRLTSSYAGLRPALGLNVAEWMVAAATGGSLPAMRSTAGRAIRLSLNSDATD